MTNHREALSAELDRLLIESLALWDSIRELDRERDRVLEQVWPIDAAAQRLRLALWAIDGEHEHSFGDANEANHRRQRELRKDGA